MANNLKVDNVNSMSSHRKVDGGTKLRFFVCETVGRIVPMNLNIVSKFAKITISNLFIKIAVGVENTDH